MWIKHSNCVSNMAEASVGEPPFWDIAYSLHAWKSCLIHRRDQDGFVRSTNEWSTSEIYLAGTAATSIMRKNSASVML